MASDASAEHELEALKHSSSSTGIEQQQCDASPVNAASATPELEPVASSSSSEKQRDASPATKETNDGRTKRELELLEGIGA